MPVKNLIISIKAIAPSPAPTPTMIARVIITAVSEDQKRLVN